MYQNLVPKNMGEVVGMLLQIHEKVACVLIVLEEKQSSNK